jgi:hypothetical protein
MRVFKQTSLCVALLISMGTLINAQTNSQLAPAASNSSAALIKAATQTKASNEALIKAQEIQVTAEAVKLEELRKLVADGLVAQVELENAEALAYARTWRPQKRTSPTPKRSLPT